MATEIIRHNELIANAIILTSHQEKINQEALTMSIAEKLIRKPNNDIKKLRRLMYISLTI